MLVPKLRFKREDGTDYPELEQYRLEDTVDFLDEKRKPITSKYRKAGQYPYYGASGIIDFIDDYIFDEELVLLSEDGANIVDRNYRVAFIATGKYWVNNHAHCLRPKQGFASYFISEALENIDYTVYNTGSAQPKLNQEVCRNLPLMCPCLEEQQKIANFLSTVDEVIAQSEAEVQNLEQQKKAAMQKIFSQEVRFKREDGTDYPEWEDCILSDYCEEMKSSIDPQKYPNNTFLEYSMPAFDMDKTPNTVIGSDMNSNRKVVNTPCVLINKLNVRKKRIWKVPNPTDNSVCSAEFIPVKSDIMSIDFLEHLSLTDCFTTRLLDCSTGTSNSQKRVTPDIIMDMPVSIPCLEEQQKIAGFLSAYDEAIRYAKQELDKWKELKKGLLQQMFV